jgi:hypothetical protein
MPDPAHEERLCLLQNVGYLVWGLAVGADEVCDGVGTCDMVCREEPMKPQKRG